MARVAHEWRGPNFEHAMCDVNMEPLRILNLCFLNVFVFLWFVASATSYALEVGHI